MLKPIVPLRELSDLPFLVRPTDERGATRLKPGVRNPRTQYGARTPLDRSLGHARPPPGRKIDRTACQRGYDASHAGQTACRETMPERSRRRNGQRDGALKALSEANGLLVLPTLDARTSERASETPKNTTAPPEG